MRWGMCSGVGVSEFRFPRRSLSVALVLLGPVLAGCSSSLPSMSSFSSMFGSSTTGTDANASAATIALPPNFECPPVQVRQGAATLTSSANPEEPAATNLRYQVSIGTTARECKMLPGNMVSIKVGMQGRVILGPEGSPGTVDVPVRFAVVQETVDSKVIATKLDRIAVTVTPNDTNVLFTHVSEGLDFPMPKGAAIDSYVIYIGFDAAAVEPEHKKPAPKAKPKAVKPTRPTG
jgi:hypothetical protein